MNGPRMSELTKLSFYYWIIILGFVVVAMMTLAFTPKWVGIPLVFMEWAGLSWWMYMNEVKEKDDA